MDIRSSSAKKSIYTESRNSLVSINNSSYPSNLVSCNNRIRQIDSLFIEEKTVKNFNNTNYSSFSIGNGKGVFAAEDLEINQTSYAVCSTELLFQTNPSKILIHISSEGFLTPLESKQSAWFRQIKISPDVHSQNSLLEINDDHRIFLRLVKGIEKDEELVCWLSEELIVMMSMPFLAPSNIIGNNCYQCNTCQTSFETPNPLKIHMATSCGRQSIDILWMRLNYTIDLKKNASNSSVYVSKIDCNATKVLRNERCSAFKPFISARLPLYNPAISFLPKASTSSVTTAAQIETIVSNMGTSKQGHLCIYCGKLYSRKYGLKIHIRTHTGFKPLKCKFCLRPFGDPSNLNKHVRLHIQTGSSAYRCHICNKTLFRRRDLQRHMQIQHSKSTNEEINKTSSSEDDVK